MLPKAQSMGLLKAPSAAIRANYSAGVLSAISCSS
jgi:hypothetical protein